MTSEGQVDLKAGFPERPFPGIHPYSSAQARVFFGREREIRDLSRLIFIHRGVVLFGRSGIGKSSLIHAGLVPELVELGLTPYRVRVQPIPGGELSIERMPAPPGGGDATVLAADQLMERVLKKTNPANTPPEQPILIFDQFEEWVTLFETLSFAIIPSACVFSGLQLMRRCA